MRQSKISAHFVAGFFAVLAWGWREVRREFWRVGWRGGRGGAALAVVWNIVVQSSLPSC